MDRPRLGEDGATIVQGLVWLLFIVLGVAATEKFHLAPVDGRGRLESRCRNNRANGVG